MKKVFDVIIIGAGPAGIMAALGAKQTNPNLEVCLIDKNMGFSHKIGEALLTGTILTFQEAGLIKQINSEGFHRKIGAAYIWGESSTPWYVNYPLDKSIDYPAEFMDSERRYSIHVPRHELEQCLRKEAKNRGVHLIEDQIQFNISQNLNNEEDKTDFIILSLQGEKESYLAKYYIDATGQSAALSKNLGLREAIGHRRVGRYTYIPNIDWGEAEKNGFHINRTNIIANQHGWMWLIHLGERGNNLTSVGFIAPPEIIKQLTFDNVIDFYPELKLFGLNNNNLSPRDVFNNKAVFWYNQPDYSYKSKRIEGKNWALVGDAAMFIDPILSQGGTLASHYGLLRGRAAAEHIAGNTQRQIEVSQHYRNEGLVLLEIVKQWYGNNRFVKDWKLKASFLSETVYNHVIENSDEAFRHITNLENIKREYWPFPQSEQQIIDQKLNIQK